LILILSDGTNSSKTEKSGMIWCRRQNPCRALVSDEEEEEEGGGGGRGGGGREDIHSIAVYL
jgi:hypothetical protein